MNNFLAEFQIDAVNRMKNGCILNGDVGTGKSRTSLCYYFKEMGGSRHGELFKKMINPLDLYIITTAKKRDSRDWENEMIYFGLSPNPELSEYGNKVCIDSWNNIQKYSDVENAFFIFDEDRVIGKGAWVKAFLKIAKKNLWILLSATPGDCWADYIPVFIANGWYKNRTDFYNQHVVWNQWSKYPKIDGYVNTGRLIKERNYLLVNMNYKKNTIKHRINVLVDYNRELYKQVMKFRVNPYTNLPIVNITELCVCLRRIINSDKSRLDELVEIVKSKGRAIIFYNYDFELEILKNLDYCLDDFEIAEWNGHKHQDIPETKNWVYLSQYIAGCEGWNCIKTDTIIFFSQSYSYRIMTQASGRIDRMNTPFIDLYYYHMKSRAPIDLAIDAALRKKKKFNERKFIEG